MAYLAFFLIIFLSAAKLLSFKAALIFSVGSLLIFFPARAASYVLLNFISKRKFMFSYFGSYLITAIVLGFVDRRVNILLLLPTSLALAAVTVYQYKDSKHQAILNANKEVQE